MKMISTLIGLSGLECRLLNKCCLPDPSSTGISAARPRSSFEGSLLDTSISPVKFPVGPSGLEGAVEAILIRMVGIWLIVRKLFLFYQMKRYPELYLEYIIVLLCSADLI